ncbi:MAG: hypothetical protein A3J58_02720 [Candidatus Sungbacteria bacterium RIFCSPHIGHO2_02_FULL_52_23]|uniref:Uncharacterized protein n=1 Tax=Candidatus Sungbacteria bacterium RIFCSPHIGHO2_02_FULL_52_23 TaxID=1802274 RepID=A0A1G2KTA4_9BACT|nr:MAG: hypothetical protein A3J58_02720 [Candidatus Sungbacteria bacterium RIFCSPHIGHO2_02_FULL_52_23]
MDNELEKRFAGQEQKLDAIYRSVERMRKYFLWTLVVTVVMIVFPLVGLLIVIPQFLNQYNSLL